MIDSTNTDFSIIEQLKSFKPIYVLICSYTIDPSFLEKKIIYPWLDNNDCSIHVICSRSKYLETANDLYSINGAGVRYIFSGINDYHFCFHAKILFAVDSENHIMLMTGGTNFTYPGLCLNFDTIDILNEQGLSVESITALKILFSSLRENLINPEAKRHLESGLSILKKIKINQLPKAEFLTNCKTSLASSIIKILSSTKVYSIKLFSPFFDDDFHTLKYLIEKLKCDRCSIITNKDQAINLAQLPSNVSVYIPNDNSDDNFTTRYIHSKFFVFYTDVGIYAFTGSGNCTNAGLLTTVGNGNWESGIFRNNVSEDQVEAIINAARIVLLEKKNYWQHVKSDIKESNVSDLLMLESYHQSGVLYIILHPKENRFPEKVNVSFIIKDSMGMEFSYQYNDISIQNNKIKLPIQEEVVLNQSCMIEVEIFFSTNVFRGSTWITNSNELRKNKKVNRLFKIVEDVEADNITGWEHLGELISFISQNMPNIKRSKNIERKPKPPSKVDKKQLLISSEIYCPTDNDIIPEMINGIDSHSYVDLGKRIERLIETGLQNDVIDDGYNEESEIPKSDRKRSETENAYLRKSTDEVERKRAIYDNLPNIYDIFKSNIFKPAEQLIHRNKTTPLELSSLSQALVFLLNLARFIKYELNEKVGKTAYRSNQPVIEAFESVSQFTKLCLKIIKNNDIDREHLVMILAGDHVIEEIFLLTAEYMLFSNQSRILEKYVVEIKELLQLLAMKGINEKVIEYYGTSRILPNWLLFDTENIDSAISMVYSLDDVDKESRLKQISEHMMYSFYAKALRDLENACTFIENDDSSNKALIPKYSNMKSIAQFRMYQMANNLNRDLVDVRNGLYSELKEINISDKSIECPKCKHRHLFELLFQLRSRSILRCEGCNNLLLPINNEIVPFNICSITPIYWSIPEEEKNEYEQYLASIHNIHA